MRDLERFNNCVSEALKAFVVSLTMVTMEPMIAKDLHKVKELQIATSVFFQV